jgi:hypothetical protein
MSHDGAEHLHQVPGDSMTRFAIWVVELERAVEEGKSGEIEASAAENYVENIRGVERGMGGKDLVEDLI